MSQPDPDPDRYKSRGRKERTPAQLAVLAQAREKAKIVNAERACPILGQVQGSSRVRE